MRTFIIIISCLLATSMIAQEKQEKPNMPFYNKQKIDQALKQQTEYDTVWLPVKATEYQHLSNSVFKNEYEYSESGLLQKWNNWYNIDGTNYIAEYIYNQTHLIEGEDVIDTITYHVYDNGGNPMPFRRFTYENYHADFWYASNDQTWENDQWTTTYRSETYLLDTLNVVGFRYWDRRFNYGVLTEGYYRTLEFDERQNVSAVLRQNYVPETGKYELSGKNEYLYDENNICYENHFFLDYGNGWMPYSMSYWKWAEFHGFLNGDLLYVEYGGVPDLYRPNKPAIQSSYYYDGGQFNFNWERHNFWNVDGNPSVEEYVYRKSGDSLYPEAFQGYYLDEHENLREYTIILMYPPGYQGEHHDTCGYWKQTHINYYDERNRFYKYDMYQISFYENEGSMENEWLSTTVVDSFTYVLKPVNIEELLAESKSELKIVPNPSDGTVRITAEDDIAAITLYASDGRLAYSRDGTGKEMIVNTEGLAAGVYIVRALLRDGVVRTGKLIKN